jgi:hypothetical protein
VEVLFLLVTEYTAEALVPAIRGFEVELAIAELKSYISSGCVKFPTELTQAGGETLRSEIHKIIYFI